MHPLLNVYKPIIRLVFGKLNMDEFAMAVPQRTPALAKTSNPWNADCVPGGSSWW